MARVSGSSASTDSFLTPSKHFAISKPFMSNSLIPTCLNPKVSSISFSVSLNNHYPSLQITCSTTSSSSSIESHEPSSTIIFIKGLPLAAAEGYLKKAFSQFGEVSRVKIMQDKKTKQSLGFAYVWFTTEKSAQLAVKEMDGKFFYGRFIFVTIARPGSCKIPRKTTQYKF